MKKEGFVLIFVLLVIVTLASLIAFLRLKAFQEAKFSQQIKAEREMALSLPGLAAYCRQEAMQIESEVQEGATTEEEILEQSEDFLVIDCSLPEMEITARFSSESIRFNLNQPEEEALQELLEEEGFTPEQAQIMTQSLLDWLDKDNEHHFLGAEKDYYEPLGYAPRNGPLATLDEVVLVRGFDPYLFWIKPGLYDLFTIYTQGNTQKLARSEVERGAAEGLLSLKTPGVFREEIEVSYLGRKWRYLEVFSTVNGEPQVLYYHLLPSLGQEEK